MLEKSSWVVGGDGKTLLIVPGTKFVHESLITASWLRRTLLGVLKLVHALHDQSVRT